AKCRSRSFGLAGERETIGVWLFRIVRWCAIKSFYCRRIWLTGWPVIIAAAALNLTRLHAATAG
ncbi:MAG TPA: hypothetical protein VE666_17145, partial [Mycobacterium sp.]|nr:hypothetical protein [Mycobacterium sp.]